MELYNDLADLAELVDDEMIDEQLNMIESLIEKFEEEYSNLMGI